MKMINNKGFTLIELIATIVLLALVMGIGAYSITTVIRKSKEQDYELLVKEIKDSVEQYYIECKYANNENIECPIATDVNGDDSYEITLNDLVEFGFLKANSKDENGYAKIVNPIDDVYIGDCSFRYMYYDGKFHYGTNYDIDSSCPELREE